MRMGQSRRRQLLVASGILLAVPSRVFAQPRKVFRIGMMGVARPDPEILKLSLEPFRQALWELGWVEGTHYVLEARWAEGKAERYPEHAAELVRLGVDVIMAVQTGQVIAARKATNAIPIVSVMSSDLVEAGMAESYARPGGNVTGFMHSLGQSYWVRQMALLRQCVPNLSKLAFFYNEIAWRGVTRKDLEAAAKSAGIDLVHYAVRDPAEFESAFKRMKNDRMQAVLILVDGMIALQAPKVGELTLKYRLPASSQASWLTQAGALMSYEIDLAESWRRAARYVDKLFRGAKPSELALEGPDKFLLRLNQKTARALGLTVPPEVLLIADRLIE